MYKTVLATTIGLLLPFAVTADNSGDGPSKTATSLMEVEVFIGGSALPDMRGKQRVYTRVDRRRIVNEYKPENWLVGKAVGHIQSDDIARLDRDVQWLLKPQNKSYIECPLAGCSVQDLAKEFKPDVENAPVADDSTEVEREPDCVAEPTKNEFTVTPTGEKRLIAGRDAQKYRVQWLIEAKDASGRVDHFEADWSMWTTAPTAAMQQAWQIHETFQNDLLKKMGEQGNLFAQVMPKEVYMSLAGFSGDLDKNSAAVGQSPFAREMRKINGYPLSMKLEISGEQNTCKPITEARQSEAKEDSSNPLDWFKNKAKKFASEAATKSFKSSKHEPLVIYQYDVKSIEVSSESDVLFDVPADYALTARN